MTIKNERDIYQGVEKILPLSVSRKEQEKGFLCDIHQGVEKMLPFSVSRKEREENQGVSSHGNSKKKTKIFRR